MPESETDLRELSGRLAPDAQADADEALQGLYTPAMLAAAVGAPIASIRRWERRGHLRATAVRNRVSYYDFGEATVARRLVEILDASGSLTGVDRVVDELKRAYPETERPLADAPLVVDAGKVFVRDGDALAEPGGQRLIDFSAETSDSDDEAATVILLSTIEANEDARALAVELHGEGATNEAIESLRLAMLRTGASPDDHFTLGEWLYEAGQTEAARERFYAALELDDDHVEARVNLACLLAESGQTELAVAAFRGTLEEHPFYADAHFHLAATLERMGDHEAATEHFRRFLEMAPESPWAEEARGRLEGGPDQ